MSNSDKQTGLGLHCVSRPICPISYIRVIDLLLNVSYEPFIHLWILPSGLIQ